MKTNLGYFPGKIGWFPEAYAQQLGENGQPVVAAEPTLQTIAEVSETSSDKGSLQDQGMLQVGAFFEYGEFWVVFLRRGGGY